MKPTKKITQFFFRLAPSDRKIIEKAAELDRRSLSDFIRLAAIDKAVEVIENEKQRKQSPKKGI